MPRTGRPRTAPESRFFQKVAQVGECWQWQGTSNRGYGSFWTGDARTYAHRWAYEYLRSDIPSGLQLDHLCRNRLCVNPWHLEPVTARENTLRGDGVTARNAAATVCQRGHEFVRDERTSYRFCPTCRRERGRTYYDAKRRNHD